MANLLRGARPIYLVGMMAAGKSSVGRGLAERLGRPFVDLDAAIELRTGTTVAEVFARHGEFDFRACEAQVLRDLPRQYPDGVVATGGGTPLHFEGMTFLRQTGTVIYLEAGEATLLRRLGPTRASRPLLNSPDWRSRVRALLAERAPVYERAHGKYHIDGADLPEVIEGLAERLPQVTGH